MRREELYLADIVEAADAIALFIADLDQQTFVGSDLIRSAVAAKLSIIGEAVTKLPRQLKERYAAVDWKKITAFRNFLVHAYFALDWEIIQ